MSQGRTLLGPVGGKSLRMFRMNPALKGVSQGIDHAVLGKAAGVGLLDSALHDSAAVTRGVMGAGI